MEKTTKKIHKRSIFIFRRDLRLEDNTGLFHALRLSEEVVPCFLFDKNQIDPSKNEYFSHNLVQFMIESLKDLNRQLTACGSRIFFFHGEVAETFRKMIDTIRPDAVFVNEDVTPYSIKRDSKFQEICNQNLLKFYSYSDCMLIAKDKILLAGGRFYQKFTPYYKTASSYPINSPEPNIYKNYLPKSEVFKGEFKYEEIDKFYVKNPYLEVHGGRTEALKVLNDMKNFKNYQQIRDFPALSTTKLSAHNKFGCVSIREVYHTAKQEFGQSCTFIQQLFWRDFYYNVVYYFPHVFGKPMKSKYNDIEFENDPIYFEKWKSGNTGCPIVDAAMRHLNKKGYMPNRLRMVVSNFLIKDLLVDWKWGEQYFAQKLVDFDPSQNNGGWQWAAGCGTDSQPYFRVFNPRLQSEKFDQNCDYILTWIPELKKVKKEHIHGWEENYKLYKDEKIDYPDPIVKHAVQKERFLKMYKSVLYGEEAKIESEDEENVETKIEERKKKVVSTKKNVKEAPSKGNKKRKSSQDVNGVKKIKTKTEIQPKEKPILINLGKKSK